ncbi:hypothetical protein BAOM_5092 [Peribacillus asahii]|uniref:Uncharacterized protein n=1 Tax=Peribacillus asahii TaxID=228899 RepID=A0A3Q9RSB2_9BACI|nr:hypothetical protein BAOM_5092 [Peribacillus asahii]
MDKKEVEMKGYSLWINSMSNLCTKRRVETNGTVLLSRTC